MHGHDIIVVGASAGGVEALVEVARALPADLPAAVFVVLHIPPSGPSMLATILGRAGALPATTARDGELFHTGHIYVAPPDHHLLIVGRYLRLGRGPKENRSRPAVDPLFRSAAISHGPRVIGVVLSGNLDDGTVGLAAIKARGGLAVVQEPHEALYPGMPLSAVENVAVDSCLPLRDIGLALANLATVPVEVNGAMQMTDDAATDHLELEAETAKFLLQPVSNEEHGGIPSQFSCPDCHGVLYEQSDGDIIRYRCRVGHAYSVETLQSVQENAVEEALWAAIRALEEKAALAQRMLRQATHRGINSMINRYTQDAETAGHQAATLRQLLLKELSGQTVGDGAVSSGSFR